MSTKSITEIMNAYVNDFFFHLEESSADGEFDMGEPIESMQRGWVEWRKNKNLELLIEKEVKKSVKKEVKKSEKKSEKKAKDKNAPKNAMSAYIIFSQDMRPIVKKEQPTLDAKDTLRALGAMWKKVDDKTKAKYQELAENDKKRFKSEMENYVPNEVEKTNKDTKKSKKPKDAPKHAKSAYMFYCAEMRGTVKEENPEMKPQDILSELGRRWKTVKDTESVKKYAKMAEKDKVRYTDEKKAYDEKVDPEIAAKKAKVKEVKEEAEDLSTKAVREIIESFGEGEVTKRKIKEILDEKGIKIGKEELNRIINNLMK
jgi:hypothetical protein